MPDSYRIFATAPFLESLKRLSPPVLRKIEKKLTTYVYLQLKQEPHFGPNIKKLRAWKPETWRFRIGPWRAFYEIDESKKIVYLLTFDWRKDAY